MFENLAGRSPGYLDCKTYAVVAPLLRGTGELLFQVRSQKLHRQPGEICFPGGRVEDGKTPLDAALRETAEELLLPRERISVVAPLDILCTPHQSVVFPYLAYLEDYAFTFNGEEVQEVFTAPFSFFLDTAPRVYHNGIAVVPDPDLPYRELLDRDSYPWGSVRYPVLFYRYKERVIWGMTARFIANLVALYRGG